MAAAWAHTPGPPPAELAGGLIWNIRPEIILPLLVLASLYALGWWRLFRRGRWSPGHDASAARDSSSVRGRADRFFRRPAFMLVGVTALVGALLSPLDALADRLFVAHMIQHMLLIVVAAPALLLADPFPLTVWALPHEWRLRIARHLTRRSIAGRAWRVATAMSLA